MALQRCPIDDRDDTAMYMDVQVSQTNSQEEVQHHNNVPAVSTIRCVLLPTHIAVSL